MAVSATFKASFENFNDAVEKAVVKVRGFESSISTVDKKLERFTDSFSGRKLIEDAVLAAKAVENIGGAATLTQTEQKRLNGLVTEALAKYKALGQEAPDHLKKLQKETATQTGLFDKLKGAITPIGGLMAGAFAVGSIAAAGKKVLDFADNIVNLSQKTGISTDGLQKLQLAFEQNGVSLDTVTTNVTKLAKTLLDGDKGAVSALTRLGVSVENLKQLAPEQQFLTVADAVGKIQNPTEKAYAAMQVFGKGGGELLQGLTGQLVETTKEFEKMGLIIDQETIESADKFGDQLGLLSKQFLGIVANIVGPLLPALSGLATLLGKVGSVVGDVTRFLVDWIQKGLVAAYAAITRFVAGIADAATHIPLLGKHLGFAGTAAQALRKSADDADRYLAKLFTTTSDGGTSVKNVTTPAMIGLGKATEDAGKKAQKAAEDYRKLMSDVRNAQGLALMEMDAALLNASRSGATTKLRESLIGAVPNIGATMAQNLTANNSLQGLLLQAVVPGDAFRKLANQRITESLTGVFSGIGNLIKGQLAPTILSALTGGGNVVSSIGGLVGGKLGENIAGDMTKGLTQKLAGGVLGKTLGGAIGSIIPGLGTVLGSFAGPLIGKIGGFIKGLFGGPSQKELEGRDTVQKFEAEISKLLTQTQKLEAGGERWKETVILVRDAYLATGRSADEAERDVKRLWDSSKKGAEEAKRAAEEINAVLMEQQADVERLNAAIVKYGFTIEELGPAMRAQQLNDQAKELVEDWRVLVGSGIDLALVNERMSEAIGGYLQMAIKTGAEVPFAMKPILQSLIDQGKLVDANGTAITDLEDAGVTFAETMTQGFDRVVTKLDELITRLQGAGLAIQNLPAIDVPVNIPDIEEAVRSRFPGLRLNSIFGAQPMAAGGAGTVTKPTLFMAGEAGPEQFAFSGANRQFASRSDLSGVEQRLDILRDELVQQRRDLPRAMRIAMSDAIALA